MDQELIARVRTTLETKSTDELRQVYTTGDRAVWSLEALEAMRQILAERGEEGLAPSPSPVNHESGPKARLLAFRLIATGLMGLGILILLVDVILVAGGNVHLSPGGDWWLQLWFVLLPAFVIFCLGATLYVLVEIALRVNSKP